jgi:hypothetical protein
MSINVIERAVTPFNESPSKLIKREEYSLYAPAAGIGKPGMAGFNGEHFIVREQIVSINDRYMNEIEAAKTAAEVAKQETEEIARTLPLALSIVDGELNIEFEEE